MSRSAPNPCLFSGYEPRRVDSDFVKQAPLPPLSKAALAQREAEEDAYLKSLAAARRARPFKLFAFWNAKLRIRTTVTAQSEEDALVIVAAQTPDQPAKAWKLIPESQNPT